MPWSASDQLYVAGAALGYPFGRLGCLPTSLTNHIQDVACPSILGWSCVHATSFFEFSDSLRLPIVVPVQPFPPSVSFPPVSMLSLKLLLIRNLFRPSGHHPVWGSRKMWVRMHPIISGNDRHTLMRNASADEFAQKYRTMTDLEISAVVDDPESGAVTHHWQTANHKVQQRAANSKRLRSGSTKSRKERKFGTSQKKPVFCCGSCAARFAVISACVRSFQLTVDRLSN